MAFNWDDHPVVDAKSPAPAPAAAAPAPGGFNWDDHPVVAAAPSPITSAPAAAATGYLSLGGLGPIIGAAGKTAMDTATGGNRSLDDIVDEYRRERDRLKDDFAKAAAAHPVIAGAGKLAGVGSMLSAAGPAAVTGPGLATTGAVLAAAESSADLTKAAEDPSQIGTAAWDATKGAAMTYLGGKAIETAAPYVGEGFENAGGWLKDKAEGLMERATGATGAQAAKFVPGTGRFMLDNDIGGYLSSPGDIAQEASTAIDNAGNKIGDILQNQAADAKVDRNSVIEYIQKKIDSLAGNEGEKDLVNALKQKQQDIADEIIPGYTEETAESTVPIQKSEEIKRSFDRNAKWDKNSDAVSIDANKTAANGYREAGENAATDVNPDIGEQFKADKNTIHMLSPVAKAAEKRASTLNQSPMGGLKDMVSFSLGKLPGVIAQRVVAPRLASFGANAADDLGSLISSIPDAVSALAPEVTNAATATSAVASGDKLSEFLSSAPHLFGKFAPSLQAAAARGPSSLGATDYILQQTNPEYRAQRTKALSSGGANE